MDRPGTEFPSGVSGLLNDWRFKRRGTLRNVGVSNLALEPDPVIEVFKRDVDRTLLRENLKLTPDERLRRMQAALRGLLELRDAFDKARRRRD